MAHKAMKQQLLDRLVGLVGSGESIAEIVAPRPADLQETIRAQEDRPREAPTGPW